MMGYRMQRTVLDDGHVIELFTVDGSGSELRVKDGEQILLSQRFIWYETNKAQRWYDAMVAIARPATGDIATA